MVKLVDNLPSYKHPLYKIWKSLKTRCYNPKCKSYPRYGGRGIDICKEWRNDFFQFALDMGIRPDKHYSIERINNDLGYYKENCKWATPKEQAINRKQRDFSLVGITTSTTGVRFISPSRGKYVVQITKKGIHHNLGRYPTLDEAKRVLYDFLNKNKHKPISIEFLRNKYGS